MTAQGAGRARDIAAVIGDELAVEGPEPGALDEAVLREAHPAPSLMIGAADTPRPIPPASSQRTGPLRALTVREREILRLVALGRRSKEIAGLLRIRPRTVSAHRANITRKLGIRKVADLVRYAVRERIIEVD